MFTIFLVWMELRFRIVIVIDARLLGILVSTALFPHVSKLRRLPRRWHGKARWELSSFLFVPLAAVVVEPSLLL